LTTESAATPLSEDDVVQLDRLLLALPEERDALDVVMLDGYLAGILLQPDPVPPAEWLPLVFDADGDERDTGEANPDRERMTGLIMRRHNELAACIAAREPFEPIVFELLGDDDEPLTGKAAIGALELWSAGFMTAVQAFTGLLDRYGEDEDVAVPLRGILRHLPADPDLAPDEAAAFAAERARLDREVPLADLDDALVDLVECVLDIAAVTRIQAPLRRDEPKVGRNDPCPCGSGRKFKLCHGRELQ
jgi:uncharacterized protein